MYRGYNSGRRNIASTPTKKATLSIRQANSLTEAIERHGVNDSCEFRYDPREKALVLVFDDRPPEAFAAWFWAKYPRGRIEYRDADFNPVILSRKTD